MLVLRLIGHVKHLHQVDWQIIAKRASGAFADLQQKYGDVLASKTPDVQEANLGDKGVRYRSVVGPPGSREAASGVCKQLKTAGYANDSTR